MQSNNGLTLLNTKGCGVCKNKEFKEFTYLSIWEQIKGFFGWKPPKRLQTVWCSKNNKWKQTTDICMKFDPLKQIKIFGSIVDEEVKFDTNMLEKKYVIKV